MIRLEQSLFWHPPDHLTVKMSQLYEIELGIFEEGYYEFVRKQRDEFRKTHKSFASVFGMVELEDDIYRGRVHPIIHYRSQYELSRMGLCKALCLHYDPITEYEQNKQREVPEQLKEACNEMGWSWDAISDAVSLWRRLGYADAK